MLYFLLAPLLVIQLLDSVIARQVVFRSITTISVFRSGNNPHYFWLFDPDVEFLGNESLSKN
jgi:hypothetical protein